MSASATDLVAISRDLCLAVAALRFSAPVAVVYNPLVYAREAHELYLRRYGMGRRDVVLVGMNPGPFGMAQTGVPFGDPGMVTGFLGISARTGKPDPEHPKRPVLGLRSPRKEASGSRLWGWARDKFGTAEAFFATFFVANHCPLCFLDAGGANVTPDKLVRAERDLLLPPCDLALRRTVEVLEPKFVVGIGVFAEARIRLVTAGLDVTVGRIPHPSPASPAANRDWAGQADTALRALWQGSRQGSSPS